jgi:hypothetical protein
MVEALFLLFFCHDREFGLVAHVAQSAEHVLGKDEVSGSIPLMGSSFGIAS